jgi:hypothetical protein
MTRTRDRRRGAAVCLRAGLALVGLRLCAACGAAPDQVAVTVDVKEVPDAARYLQPAVAINRRLAEDLRPVSIEGRDREALRVRLFFSMADAQGQMAIGVRALDDVEGKGCTVAVGSHNSPIDREDLQVQLRLEAVLRECTQRPPVLAKIIPPQPVPTPMNAPELALYGWGFSPRVEVTLGETAPLRTEWRSPAMIAVEPDYARLASGPVSVRVRNPDDSQTTTDRLLTLP